MARQKTGWFGLLSAIALAASAGLTLRAQGPAEPKSGPESDRTAGACSVQDALLRPFHFTFARPTPLEDVARILGQSLKVRVVVDRAAIDRLGLKMNDEVQLELEGIRLKTGLKLLLDQLDLTYRVVPEDNLLVITDTTGSVDPIDQVMTQLLALHQDLHDAQDAIDEVRAALGIEDEPGAKVRKPTIIEEKPPADEADKDKTKSKEPPAPSTAPRSRPGF